VGQKNLGTDQADYGEARAQQAYVYGTNAHPNGD
jgi:hypothetical protein